MSKITATGKLDLETADSITTVILNGPSREPWLDFTFPGPTIGCNYAYRDFVLFHCCAIDRMTVAHMRGDMDPTCTYWLRKGPLEVPPGWLEYEPPGIDSGSMAIDLACHLYSWPVLVIGGDGILGQRHETAYEYPWHRRPPDAKIHQRHRQTVEEIVKNRSNLIVFVSEQPDPYFNTITMEQAYKLLKK